MEKQDVSKGEPDGDMPSDSPFSFTLQGIADNLPSFCAQYIELPNLCNTGKIPKNKLIRKLDIGDRDIYKEYISYCHYKGRKIRSIERRRKMEFLLLYEK